MRPGPKLKLGADRTLRSPALGLSPVGVVFSCPQTGLTEGEFESVRGEKGWAEPGRGGLVPSLGAGRAREEAGGCEGTGSWPLRVVRRLTHSPTLLPHFSHGTFRRLEVLLPLNPEPLTGTSLKALLFRLGYLCASVNPILLLSPI